jgi:hypothetical protein
LSTELTTIERAKAALKFDETRSRLAELAEKSAPLVSITNTAGYQEVHRARMDLKNTRVEIQRRGKDAREDAQAFSKAVIAAEKELVGVIEPEESRLQGLQDAWDAAREAERQAKIEAERQRVEAIQERISHIRCAPARALTEFVTPYLIRNELAAVESIPIDETFAEFAPAAEAAKAEAVKQLTQMVADVEAKAEAERQRQHQEAERAEALRIESEKLAAERAELDRLRAEQAERDRIEREAREAELAAERAKIEAQQAELRALQEAAAKAQAEAEAAQRAAQEAQRKAEEDARRAELERQREAERVAREAAEAQAEAARQQAAEAAAARIAAEIASATLREAAEEAIGLLTELGEGEHITTRKLAAALARDDMKEAA